MSINYDYLFSRLLHRISKTLYETRRKEGTKMGKCITIRSLINTNKKVGIVQLKSRQQVFNEIFEVDLGRYYTVKGKNNETVLHECTIPLDTEITQWFYDGTGVLTLTLNGKQLGVKPC